MKTILTFLFILCSSVFAQADPPSYVDASALTAYYYLSNDAYNTMPGNPYSGTSSSSPTYSGSYASFDGNHIDLGLPALGTSGSFAITFWMRTDGTQWPYGCLFNKWDHQNKGIIIGFAGNNNRIRVDVGNGSGYSFLVGNTPVNPSDGWVHIAVSVDITSQGTIINILRNGVPDGNSGAISPGFVDSGYSAEVGYDSQYGASRVFIGDMQDLAIWNRSIHGCEAAKMKEQGNYFASQPTSLTIDVAQSATFSLSCYMGNFDPYYTWVNQDNVQMTTWQQGGSSSSFTLSPPLTGGGTYKCILGLGNLGSDPNCLVYSDPVTLTVTCNSVPTPSITGPSTISVGQQATFSIPTSAGYSYGWWTNGANANTISGSSTANFTCQFTQPGTTNIFSHYKYGSCDKSSSAKVVTVSSTTAVGDEIEESVFGVFPNPASEMLVVKTRPDFLNKPYQLTNQLGQVVLEGTLNLKQTSINVQHLPPGMYWITSGENRQSVMVRN